MRWCHSIIDMNPKTTRPNNMYTNIVSMLSYHNTIDPSPHLTHPNNKYSNLNYKQYSHSMTGMLLLLAHPSNMYIDLDYKMRSHNRNMMMIEKIKYRLCTCIDLDCKLVYYNINNPSHRTIDHCSMYTDLGCMQWNHNSIDLDFKF